MNGAYRKTFIFYFYNDFLTIEPMYTLETISDIPSTSRIRNENNVHDLNITRVKHTMIRSGKLLIYFTNVLVFIIFDVFELSFKKKKRRF